MTDIPPPVARKKARILCVDDEEQVLAGLDMLLGRRFAVVTATSGAEGLHKLEEFPDIEVIISDMRMPGMDGAAFLRTAREVAPDATRILLTGQAELGSAIAAINEGQIFRFLTKPCPPSELQVALDAAVKQHRLVVGERELLEGTLQGSIKAMIEVLSIANPLAFGRATRVQVDSMRLAEKLDMGAPWQLNVAAVLMELGSVTLADALLEKMNRGGDLNADEKASVDAAYQRTDRLLANIPRMDVVRAIVSLVAIGAQPADLVLAPEDADRAKRLSRVLRAAMAYDRLEAQGMSARLAVETLESTGEYSEVLIEAMNTIYADGGQRSRLRELLPAELRAGMVLADDVRMGTGAMLVPRGVMVSESLLARLANLAPGALRGKVRVYVDALEA